MKYQIGIIGDDITGTLNMASLFGSNNLVANTYFYDRLNIRESGDIILINTNSRFDKEKTAYKKAYDSTIKLKEIGVKKFINKTCTTFRGNIGAELDGVLDALGENFAPLVIGYPDNNRTTINSIQYINNIPISETEQRNDLMNPVTESNLIKILQSQTNRKVGSINYNILDKPVDNIKEIVEELKEKYNYLIFDIRDNNDLEKVSKVLIDYRVIGGSLGIGEPLGKLTNSNFSRNIIIPKAKPNYGVLTISGSITKENKKQIQYAEKLGIKTLKLEPNLLFSNYNNFIVKIINKAIRYLENNDDLIIYSSNTIEEIEETKKIAETKGLSKLELSNLIGNSLGNIVKEVIEHTNINRLLICGGDTSEYCCRKLNIRGFTSYKKVNKKLGSSITLDKNPLLIILKPGSSIGDSLIYESIEYLRNN